MTKLKKIGVLSLAKLQAITMALVGFIIGIIFFIGGLFFGITTDSIGIGMGFSFLSIIIFPIIYGVMGFIGGVIGALLYNLSSKWTGGIEIYLEDNTTPEKQNMATKQ